MQSPLFPNTTANSSLPINPGGAVMKMEPLTLLQVAIKDNVDVLYLSAEVPVNVLFVEDGSMGKTEDCIYCASLCVCSIYSNGTQTKK